MSWYGFAIVAVILSFLISACSSSSKTPGSSNSGGTVSTPAASISGSAVTSKEVGVSATEIKVALIADVNTSVVPGLFQKNVDGVNAWATIVNANGGIAGRKVVVDFCDGKLDANATTNCVIKACQNDFALVGTAANVLTDVADLDGCKDATGKATGIPNLSAVTFAPQDCDSVTYTVIGQGNYCKTKTQNPQEYTYNIGDFRYFTKTFQDLHGVWVYNGDVPAVKLVSVPGFTMGANLGIGKDGQGFYTSTGQAPQSALTPIIQVLKRSKSTFFYGGATAANTVLIRREAKLQGVSTVKAWGCNSQCYDNSFIQQGGSAVDGEYSTLFNLPWLSEYQSNPAFAALIKQLGGTDKYSNNALGSYLEALLFQDVATKAAATGTLTRESLFTALKNEHDFDAQGIVGKTDIATHTPSPCFVLAQIKDGKWVRAYPSAVGTFDCDSANLGTIKLNLTK